MFGKKTDNRPTLGVYIHIPFCRSKCDYCDFYSLAGKEARMADYQKALLAHIKETGALAGDFLVDTIYFGGGTPSFYGEKYLRELLSAVKKAFHVAKDAEITMEANPDSVDLKGLKGLRREGFNRISMGMQSACPAELQAIHRPHTAKQVDEAVSAARKAGFENISLRPARSEHGLLAADGGACPVPCPPAPVLLRSEGGGGYSPGPARGGGGGAAR